MTMTRLPRVSPVRSSRSWRRGEGMLSRWRPGPDSSEPQWLADRAASHKTGPWMRRHLAGPVVTVRLQPRGHLPGPPARSYPAAASPAKGDDTWAPGGDDVLDRSSDDR
jgi:hypothetical protein